MASVEEDDMLASLLPFHRRIVEELITEDGLCILSAGMGWQKVVRNFAISSRSANKAGQNLINCCEVTYISKHIAREIYGGTLMCKHDNSAPLWSRMLGLEVAFMKSASRQNYEGFKQAEQSTHSNVISAGGCPPEDPDGEAQAL